MLSALLYRIRTHLSPSQHFGVRLGRLLGVEIWCHWWLLVVTVLVGIYQVPWSGGIGGLCQGLLLLTALPFSVLCHELGHAYVARRLGGGAERLVLLPVGGLVPCPAPPVPQAQLLLALGGPLSSLSLLVLAAIGTTQFDGVPLWPSKTDPSSPTLALFLQHIFLWNAYLLVINAVPCYPIDAARALLAGLWSRTGSYPLAAQVTLRSSRFVALLAFAAGGLLLLWSLGDSKFGTDYPLLNALWSGLIVVGFLHFQEAHKLKGATEAETDEPEGIFGYDFSQGYTSLEKSRDAEKPAAAATKRQAARREAARARREEERLLRLRVDALLEKIHASGLKSLTWRERRFLRRASRRYRSGAPRDGDPDSAS